MSAKQMKAFPSAPPQSPRKGNANETAIVMATESKIWNHEPGCTINLIAVSKSPTG
jgi:hypothetical protein